MAIIPQAFMDAVVAIGIRKGTDIRWIGTGFFVIRIINENGDGRPFLVTNKHVLQNKQSIVIRMKEKDSSKLKDIDTPVRDNGKALYEIHDNPKIDIAVLGLNANYIIDNNLSFPAFDIDKNAMASYELRANGVDEGTLIHMLGFTLGMVNSTSGVPICRLGCVARMNEEQISEDNNILVDVQNFPGNSGSPILVRPENTAIKGTKYLSRCVLLGIVHSYIPFEDSLTSTSTGKIVEVRTENSGIANVHPVEFIRDIISKVQKS